MSETPTRTLSGSIVRNGEIYGAVNARNFEPLEMVCRAQRFIACVIQAVTEGKTERISYHVCMAFSWTCAAADRLHFSIDMAESPESRACTLREMQEVCGRPPTLEEGALDLSRALMQTAGAFEYYRQTHQQEFFDQSLEELANLFECLCRFASFLGTDLALRMEEIYGQGCPSCRKVPCMEFTAFRVV